MIEEERLPQGIAFAQEGILSRGIEQAAVFVAHECRGERENVIGSVLRACQKNDTEGRSTKLATALCPTGKQAVLIAVVSEQLVLDALMTEGVDGFSRVIDFKEHMKRATGGREQEVAVRALALLSGLNHEFVLAMEAIDVDAELVSGNERMHDDFCDGHRVLKAADRDLGEEAPRWLFGGFACELARTKTFGGQLVVMQQAPRSSGREASQESRCLQSLQSLTHTTLIEERLSKQRVRLENEIFREHGAAQQSQERLVAGRDDDLSFCHTR